MGTINIQSTDLSHKAGLTYTGTSDKTIDVNNVLQTTDTTASIANGKVVVDSSGNVGIGVTPSAWNSTDKTLEFPNGSHVDTSSSVPALSLGTNATYPGGASWLYKTNNPASRYNQYGGIHTWYTAPSGTAGNAITWTTAMTLVSNGNLLVGTATDNGVDKLQVNGSVNITTNQEGIDTYNQSNILVAGLSAGNASPADTVIAEISIPSGTQGLYILTSSFGSILYFGGCFFDGGSNATNLTEISRSGRTNNSYGMQAYAKMIAVDANNSKLQICKSNSFTTVVSHTVYFRAIIKN